MPTEHGTDQRQKILSAALRVFARQGFHKASIKQIAAEAEIKSPALIYWYFKDKRELLSTLTQDLLPFRTMDVQVDSLLEQEPEVLLPVLLRKLLDTFDQPDTRLLLRVVFSEISQDEELTGVIRDVNSAGLDFLTSYLNRQVEMGWLRSHDTTSSARFLAGSILTVLLGRSLLPRIIEDMSPIETYVETVVSAFLEGTKTRKEHSNE
ncbi:MAG TPA: TetR/AcrR family transcriptional regulator [Anaerolineales bacterium]|nr:TetR/AcrR family transcriptional regulator [Anaerolineales bacterium]